MRLAASIQRLLHSLLLACSGRLWAFAIPAALVETASEDLSLRQGSPREALHTVTRRAENTIFPARYYFGPFAIGPP